MSSALPTSQEKVATRPRAVAETIPLASSNTSGRRASIATSAPDAANSLAIARPSPLLPPVMTALRPSSRMSMSGLLPQGLRNDKRPSPGGQAIDLLHLCSCQCPAGRADILLDLFRPGGPGDDARHLRAPRQPADGELEERAAALGGEALEALDDRPIIVGQIAVGRSLHIGQTGAFWHRRVAFVLAGQQAVSQRRERDQAEAIGLQHRHHLAVEPARQQAVLLLARDEMVQAVIFGRPLRLDDLPGRERRATDVADLALADQIVERPQGLLDRGQRIGLVLLIEVDPIGLEAPEAGLDLGHDVMARGALEAAGCVHRPRELGRQHDVLAAISEDFPEERLGAAARVAIGVGLVEKRDAEVERFMDHLAGRCEIDPPPEIVAAETDDRDEEAGLPEISLFHPFLRPQTR